MKNMAGDILPSDIIHGVIHPEYTKLLLLNNHTPCTLDNQIAILKKAGFSSVKMVWRIKNTTIVVAKK
jgi:hypothetical protein